MSNEHLLEAQFRFREVSLLMLLPTVEAMRLFSVPATNSALLKVLAEKVFQLRLMSRGLSKISADQALYLPDDALAMQKLL